MIKYCFNIEIKKNNLYYTKKINEGEIKIFPEKLELREFIACKLAVQEMLKEFIRLKRNDTRWKDRANRKE